MLALTSIRAIKLQKILPFPLLIAVLALAPLAGAYYESLLLIILAWTALAVSWNFFSGLTKYVSLGSAAFFGIGVYVTAIFGKTYPFPVVVLLAGALIFAFALGVGLVTLRLKGIYFAIFTFGLGELFKNAILWWEIHVTGTRGRFVISFDVYYPILIISLATLLLVTFLRRSKLGLALRMIGECEDAAVHLGVNASLYKTLGFAISSMCIGLVGACFAPRWTYVDSGMAFDLLYSFMPAIMTLLGGAGTVYGPVLGAVILSLLDEYLRTTFGEYFMIILGSTLMVLVLFLPYGIAGFVEKLRGIIKLGGKQKLKAHKCFPNVVIL